MDDELLVKQLPHSTEAEQAVLGSMLIDARCIPAVIEKLRPDDFYLKQDRDIYETIYSMFSLSETIDPVTVLDKMRLNGVFDENTSRSYILQLMEITPTAANVGEYVEILRDKSLLRHIAETAGELTSMVQDGTAAGQEVLDAAEQRIYALRQGRSSQGLIPLSSVVLDVLDRLEELSKSDSAVPGLSTGLPRRGQRHLRPEQLRPHPSGRPARHGQDLLRPERPAPGGQVLRQDGGLLLPGDEPGAAGHAPHLQ